MSASDIKCVSVIVPVFNDESGLQACLNSLRAQTYRRFEIIVVDNGSNPPIQLSSATYPFAIRLCICQTPGSYAARNAGVELASGDILAFTDADCTPAPTWIENGVAALLVTDRTLIGGNVSFTAPLVGSGTELYQYETGFQQRENIEQKGFSATANLFCTRAQFLAIGPFDERLLSCGDREWARRAAKKGYRFIYIENAQVYTSPRTSLRGAIRQARRVVAGRAQLKNLELDHLGYLALQPHRTGCRAAYWIMTRPARTLVERLRMLAAAMAIRSATIFEGIRLRLGGAAERR